MDTSGVPMPTMNWEATNLPEAWRKFQQHAELMFSGPLKKKGEDEKCSYLLLWVGEKGRDIFNTWSLSADEAKVLKSYYDRFTAYVEPKANVIFARYKFHEKIQGDREPFEHFVTDLRLLAKDCNYANSDEMIRDRIVFGIHSPKVREKLLNAGSELTLEKAIDIARSHELAQAQLKTISNSMSTSREHAVHSVFRNMPQGAVSKQHKAKHTRKYSENLQHRNATSVHPKGCGYCGNNFHVNRSQCPARGKVCKICGKLNHFAKVCHSNSEKTVHAISKGISDQTEESDDELFIDSVTQGEQSSETEQAFVNIKVGPKQLEIRFKLDTGSAANVIPIHEYAKLSTHCTLQQTSRLLIGYGGEHLLVKGKCDLKCKHRDIEMIMTFYVVDTVAPPVIGLKGCIDFGLIKLVLSVTQTQMETPVLKEFADVFKGIGLFPGECTIHLDPDATPVVHPPRRIPLALRSRLKDELDSMEQQDVIIKVTEPTEWVNSMVVAEKPRTGRLRVCLDPRDLNKAIKRPHYPLPTLEDLTCKLAGAQFFSVLDARSGYWAIKLTEESSKLTTFNTVFGRYRFRRLPFGLISAQDEFQRKIDETYEGLNGVMAIVDDVLIFGKTKAEHDENLLAMLQRSRQRGVKLNPEKSIICATEVSYFGHLLTADGIKPDPKKVAAVRDMEPPKDKGELETVLGMINYLSKFAPGLADVNAPLRQLLKESSEFVWDAQHEKAFKKIKDLLTSEPGPVLAYFDPVKELRLQVDASKYGLGAVLLQNERPIAYASKSLSESEINYAQIEKELFAVLFGCKRFHQYIYGRHIIIESDHKPLESIMRKPLASVPPRLQRMILQLQKYNFTIVHRPGKDIPVADTLSRKSLSDQDMSLTEGMDIQVHTVYSSLPVSDSKLEEIRVETEKDPQFQKLQEVIQNGWPEEKKKCPMIVSEFWNHRDELSYLHGIIFKGEKIVMPTSLRSDMLSRIHASHLGIEKCKQRARDIMFWPGMGKEIESIISKCSVCLTYRPSNTKEPMISHKIPDRPWQVVATDLFTWNNEDYLVTVDYYSRYFELDRLHSTTSAAVIHKLKAAFARHGIPETVISDNGPQYSSGEFASFVKAWEFTHTTTSPYYPQSNGLAEKSVHTAKMLLEKAKADRGDPYLSLLEYRNCPVDGFKSPAQLLMSRRLRSTLPNTNQQLLPKVISCKDVRAKRLHKQQRQKSYYDRSARPLPQLTEGQAVRVQERGYWKPATIIKPANTERSYHVCTSDGQEYRRNRRHLMNVPEPHSNDSYQVLGDTNKEPCTTSENDISDTPEHTDVFPKPTVYRTRYGRQIKPRDILDL